MTTVEIEKAATSEAISWAHSELALGIREIGMVVEADERTVRRWKGREVVPRGHHREKIEQIRELRHLLEEVFENKAEAREWLLSSVRAFRGRTPISLLRQGKIDSVITVLATVESGAYL